MMWKPVLVLTGIICLLILTFATYRIKGISDENRVEALDRDSSKMFQDINYKAFSTLDRITNALASSKYIKEMRFTENKDCYDRAKAILNTVKETTDIDLCYVMDLKGEVKVASEYTIDKNLRIEGENYSFRPYFINAIKGENVIFPGVGVTTKLRGIYFSSPVRGKDNKIVGVVTCKIGMRVIDKILGEYKDKCLIATNDGIVFSTNTKGWLYKSVLPITKEKLNNIVKSKQFSDNEIKPLNIIVKNDSAIIGDEKYYLSQNKIGKTGWILMVMSEDNGLALLTTIQLKSVAAIFIILIALMLTILVLINDVFKRRVTELTLKKLFHAVEQSSSTVFITDMDGVIEYVNPKFTELTGYSSDEIIDKKANLLKSGEHEPEFYRNMWRTISSGENWRGEICNKRKDGSLYWEDANISSVKNSKGVITNFIAIKEDITKRRELNQKLNEYATTDEMTGTYNRRSCLILMDKQMNISRRRNEGFVIFFMDINGLKSVNDTLGHSSGDELITSAVKCIKASLRDSDSICRLGGDEFLVILPNTSVSQAEIILDRIRGHVSRVNNEEKYPFLVSIAIGLAQYTPQTSLTVDELMQAADERMYENKAEIKHELGKKGVFR